MKIAAEKGILVSCHSEAPTLAEKARPYRKAALEIMKKYGLSAWGSDENQLAKVPAEELEKIDSALTQANSLLAVAEDSATYRNIQLAKEAGCRIHIAHCSTKNSIEIVRQAKNEIEKGRLNKNPDYAHFNVTCEVTPHHLALTGDTEPMIRALVNPPLRHEEDRLALIEALRDGTADVISTDHAPHTLEDKTKDTWASSPGIPNLETVVPLLLTEVNNGNIDLRIIPKILSQNAARVYGLENKGEIAIGKDADFTVIDMKRTGKFNIEEFKTKAEYSPFDGWEYQGTPVMTIVNGKVVMNKI